MVQIHPHQEIQRTGLCAPQNLVVRDFILNPDMRCWSFSEVGPRSVVNVLFLNFPLFNDDILYEIPTHDPQSEGKQIELYVSLPMMS